MAEKWMNGGIGKIPAGITSAITPTATHITFCLSSASHSPPTPPIPPHNPQTHRYPHGRSPNNRQSHPKPLPPHHRLYFHLCPYGRPPIAGVRW